MAVWSCLIQGAEVFDGTGEPPQRIDVALQGGKIAALGVDLPADQAEQLIDGSGQWLMPGLLDVHTHLDLEVDLQPALPEVLRHGTTTVIVGNCSLGTCFGKQDENGDEPIIDCFTRVENIPKSVLAKCSDAITWQDTAGYLKHLEQLPLGPNIAAFVPHSMLRIEAMGLDASIRRDPTEAELTAMETLLEQAMDQGYLGLSTDGLPFHYLANDPHTDKRIPTQFAGFGEMKRLLKVVRQHDRVWQTTPIIESRLKAFGYFMLTSGRLFGRTLKTSALSVMEFALAPKAANVFLTFARLVNSRLLRGQLHFQALGTNFRVWSDGVVSPLFEELESTCELIAKEYDDRAGRLALLNDPDFVQRFRRDWFLGRRGYNLAHLKARLGWPDLLVIRDLERMVFDGAPVPEWEGETLQSVYERVQQWQSGAKSAARSEAEQQALNAVGSSLADEADFMLHLLREYDKGFRFWVDVANVGNRRTLDYLLHDSALPGFNDSGAHITNMAFFDANLMSLKLAQAQSLATVAKMVRRLTAEPAAFFGLPVGELRAGAPADLVLLDPAALANWDSNEHRIFEHRDVFDHMQMLNRSDGVVSHVWVGGSLAWDGSLPASDNPVSSGGGRLLRAA